MIMLRKRYIGKHKALALGRAYASFIMIIKKVYHMVVKYLLNMYSFKKVFIFILKV